MVRGGTPPGTPPVRGGGPQRHISQNDKDGWLDAASKRTPPRQVDRTSLRNYLHARNPWRWRQLQKHLRWAEDEMLKLGLNPEDTRWIL